MSFETIKLDQQGPVAIISLNRPGKLNAINKTMLLELDAALDDIEKNDSVYTVVITGNGCWYGNQDWSHRDTLRKQFNQILREQGMKAALAWREQRLKQFSWNTHLTHF